MKDKPSIRYLAADSGAYAVRVDDSAIDFQFMCADTLEPARG